MPNEVYNEILTSMVKVMQSLNADKLLAFTGHL